MSSSDDEGTQKLLAAAPDLIVPELRPYRTRADTSGWTRDEGIVKYLEARLVEVATEAARSRVENGNAPQRPALPRADRDAMDRAGSPTQWLVFARSPA